jgi:phosphatidylglycerol---prolipoprotein diacylglyceryl transferase
MFASPGAIALQIGPLAVRWYGLLIATGVLLGTTLAHREAVRRGLNPDKLLNTIVVAVLCSLVGARLYYVLFNWDYYGTHLGKIPAVWEGGLAIHGGLIAGVLATVWYCRHAGLSLPVVLDTMAPSVVLGQAIGRWGNFFNQEAFGVPTDLPWKLYIDPAHRPPYLAGFEYFHPTFLYESLWNLLVFAILWFGLRRRWESTPGALVLAYLGLYSVGRFCVEGLRIDSLMLGPLRAAQVVSLLLIALSAAGLIALRRRRGRPAQGDTHAT